MLTPVVVEKVTVIRDPRCGRNMLQGRKFVHAFLSFHPRRPAHHDGATLSFGSPVLLLPSGRSSSAKLPPAANRQVSTTDPDSTYATKGGTPARLGYYDNYLVGNHSCRIVGVQATAARMSQETVAAQDMLARFSHRQGQGPETVAADTTYGNGEFLQWLLERNITPYMRTRDSIHRKNSPFFGSERFTYQPESNSYRCPAGQQLNYGGHSLRNRCDNCAHSNFR